METIKALIVGITGYITLHPMDPKLVRMTVGCGISHTITKTHIQYYCIVASCCTCLYPFFLLMPCFCAMFSFKDIIKHHS
jgi:hypothetical protein